MMLGGITTNLMNQRPIEGQKLSHDLPPTEGKKLNRDLPPVQIDADHL